MPQSAFCFTGNKNAGVPEIRALCRLERLVHRPLVEANPLRDLPIPMEQTPLVLSCAGAWKGRFDEPVPGNR
jgi:hypothetical protein